MDGRTFASKAEMYRFQVLSARQEAGDISNLKCQPTVHILGNIKYRPDFHYMDHDEGQELYEDVKGIITDRFRFIMRLWPYLGEIPLIVSKHRGGTRFDTSTRINPDIHNLATALKEKSFIDDLITLLPEHESAGGESHTTSSQGSVGCV